MWKPDGNTWVLGCNPRQVEKKGRPMHLQAKPFKDGVVVTVEQSRVDAAVAVQFKETVRDYFATYPGRAILDLHNVDFIDSSGLGALVAVMKSLPKERSLEVAALTPIVEKVVRLTRMDKVFIVHRSVESALAGGQSAA